VGQYLKEAVEQGEEWTAFYNEFVVRNEPSPPNFLRVACTPMEFAEALFSPEHISTVWTLPLELRLLGRYAGVNLVTLGNYTHGHCNPTRYAYRRPELLEISLDSNARDHPVLSSDHATVILQLAYQSPTSAFDQPNVSVVESFKQMVKGTGKLRFNAKLFETLGEVQRREMEALARVVEVVRGHGIDENLLPEGARDFPAGHYEFPEQSPDTPYMVVSTHDTVPDGNCFYR
jgi:hypothetical protein